MVFISCTAGFGSMMGLCAAIVNAVSQEALRLSLWDHALEAELMRLSLEIRLPGVSASRSPAISTDASVSAAEFLRSSLLRLWERAFRVHGYGAMVVLDDVNLLQAIDSRALMLLRAVFQDLHMYQAHYALAITGPSGLFSDARDVAEPVTRFFEHLTLAALALDDMDDAVREPIQAAQAPTLVDRDAIVWLWERTQGHPYFVTYVMHYVFHAAMHEQWAVLTVSRLQTLWPTILARLDHGKFSDDWNAATPAEQQALFAIAKERVGSINRGLVTRLVRKGLVAKIDRGQYQLYHPMFQEYVRRMADQL